MLVPQMALVTQTLLGLPHQGKAHRIPADTNSSPATATSKKEIIQAFERLQSLKSFPSPDAVNTHRPAAPQARRRIREAEETGAVELDLVPEIWSCGRSATNLAP
jgi:hypothetical protein